MMTTTQDGREARMRLVIGTIILLSSIDLIMTIMLMTCGKMIESNPLAEWLMEAHPSPRVAIGILKGTSVYICCRLLWAARRSPWGEGGAWLGVGILVCVLFMWTFYIQAICCW